MVSAADKMYPRMPRPHPRHKRSIPERMQEIGSLIELGREINTEEEEGWWARGSNALAGERISGSTYPTRKRAVEAIEGKDFYGEAVQAYTTGKAAALGTKTPNEIYERSDESSVERGTPSTQMQTLFAQTGVAVRRSPLAALGFDPRRVVTETSGKSYNFGGFYAPDIDRMWFDPKQASSVVHESVHRGLQKLKERGVNYAGDEELLVRRIMQRSFGQGTELGRGDAGDAQAFEAVRRRKELDPIIDELNEFARQEIAKQGKTRR